MKLKLISDHGVQLLELDMDKVNLSESGARDSVVRQIRNAIWSEDRRQSVGITTGGAGE